MRPGKAVAKLRIEGVEGNFVVHNLVPIIKFDFQGYWTALQEFIVVRVLDHYFEFRSDLCVRFADFC